MTQHRTLVVRLESDDSFHDDVRRQLATLEDGDAIDEPHVLSLPDEQALSRVLSPKNLELLRTIVAQQPSSMREAARLVDRDIKDVSRNLTELHELGLIEYDTTGRSKRPLVQYDQIAVDIDISGDPSGESDRSDQSALS